jgi:carbonic anhydrase/acetyltransferase-like protein (isoleucine patch superfamily)
MDKNFTKRLSEIYNGSQFIRSIKNLKKENGQSRLFADSVRGLSEKEIEKLIDQGNTSSDWLNIRVVEGFQPNFIRNSSFEGRCVLGIFSGVGCEISTDSSIPSGIYNSIISNCEIGNECCINRCGLISNYCVKDNAIIFHTGLISVQRGSTFGNGLNIPVGMETGGREVASCAEIDVTIAEAVALQRHDTELIAHYDDFVKYYCNSLRCDFGLIESNVVIRSASEIRNTYIGAYARIIGATDIENCTILSGAEQRTEISHGAFVKNSCVQWGCTVSSMAIITESLLTEHSHVERHGKVTASIIGPNTEIAEGEVTSCLIGPFVGFHHQALLIAALWPEGKGNVGYGANVGSNHTSRAPDQEVFCGEGIFFGLGSNIKFPADFSQAPYSIFATGVSTLPQKIEFPFSLIQSPTMHFDGISPSFNEIVPAWVLSDNIYMLLRNESKYKKRNKAKRTSFNFTVFRPDIVEKMLKARQRLSAIKQEKTIYTDKDIPGLGKNVLKEEKRRKAITAYITYIEYYCLLGLKDRITEIIPMKAKDRLNDSVYEEKTEEPLWEHQRCLLIQEGFSRRNLQGNLERLKTLLGTIVHDALLAKEKDDTRGMAIIPGYRHAALKTSEDPFIIDLTRQTKEASMQINEVISLL